MSADFHFKPGIFHVGENQWRLQSTPEMPGIQATFIIDEPNRTLTMWDEKYITIHAIEAAILNVVLASQGIRKREAALPDSLKAANRLALIALTEQELIEVAEQYRATWKSIIEGGLVQVMAAQQQIIPME